MKSKWFVHGVWAVFALVLAIAVGFLVRKDPGEVQKSVTQVTDPRDGIYQDLMIALGQAKNFHGQAKVHRSDGKLPDAIAAVRQILSLRFPVGAPEAEDVRQDARALLASLLLELAKERDDGGESGKALRDEAMQVVEEGIATRTRDSFFVANLWTVKGEIHYARAQKDAGPKVEDERRAAIDSFEKSIKINVELQKQLESK